VSNRIARRPARHAEVQHVDGVRDIQAFGRVGLVTLLLLRVQQTIIPRITANCKPALPRMRGTTKPCLHLCTRNQKYSTNILCVAPCIRGSIGSQDYALLFLIYEEKWAYHFGFICWLLILNVLRLPVTILLRVHGNSIHIFLTRKYFLVYDSWVRRTFACVRFVVPHIRAKMGLPLRVLHLLSPISHPSPLQEGLQPPA
jgi:hypothetical protein